MVAAPLLEPDLVRKIVVVWLRETPPAVHDGIQPDAGSDAARVIFDSGVPFVQILGVASHLRPHAASWMKPSAGTR